MSSKHARRLCAVRCERSLTLTCATIVPIHPPPVQSKHAWKATLKLPLTDLPMRAKAATRDALYTARCTTELYQRQRGDPQRDGRPFVMHDGPPYANGPVHMGHLLNKVLKDVINRYKLLRGQRVDYVPGWDCHGLPIELKALEKRIAEGGGAPGDALGIRADARALAESTVAEHRAAGWARARRGACAACRGFPRRARARVGGSTGARRLGS